MIQKNKKRRGIFCIFQPSTNSSGQKHYVEKINDPVSQLDETTGVEIVNDPDNNIRSDMDQQYGKRSYQYRLRPTKIKTHYQTPKNRRNRKSKPRDVATNKRQEKPR